MEQTPLHVKKGIRIFITLVFACAVFLFGVYVGYENRPAMAKVVDVVNKEAPSSLSGTTDFAPFWKAWKIVEEKFPGAEKTDSRERMYGAIKGLLASFGDPYTTFFPPKESEAFETQISGEFSGVGIEIDQKDGVLTVIAPLKGTPADRAGIKAGDIILKIDDTITSDLTIDDAIDRIRGKSGTDVTLTVLREGEKQPKVFVITRATITLPTVETTLRASEGVFVISLYNFSGHAYEDFKRSFMEYLSSGMHRLVIDLRGNPGGYLNAAVDIASLFLPEGEVVVKEIGKDPSDVTVHVSRGRALWRPEDKMVILVDKGSASASEILAGALSEHGLATLAGTKTFGKGSVQELIRLTPDTSMKITVAKWYTPNGVSISENGLTPETVLNDDASKEGDEQLEAAITLIKKL